MALPNGYTRLKYIQSTGTQYIDTRFKANNNTRLVIDMQMTDTSVNNQWLYGARDATKTNSFGFYWYNDAFGVNYGTRQNSIAVPSEATDRLFIDHNKNVVSFNGATSTNTTATWSGAYNLALLAVNTTGTTGNNVRAKLYSCQIYNNSTLIRDFVPCKNSSGVVGLYDVVNGAFYENKGSGTFVAGAELVPEYKTVDATMLDTALSATADAIRAKSGKSDDILWGETSGFASAVSAIEGGSKIATGSITPSSASGTLTVSGLNFKPKHVVVMIHPTLTVTPSYTVVASAEYGLRTSYTQYMGATGSKSLDNGDGYLSGTLSDGGFTLKITGTSAGAFFPASPYNYIAIG